MMKVIYESLFQPRKVVEYVNYKSKKFLLILVFLPLILMLPVLLLASFKPEEVFDTSDDYYQMFLQMNLEGYQIEDYKLNRTTQKDYVVGSYHITIGKKQTDFTMYHLVFDESHMSFYISNYLVTKQTYQELNLKTLNFNAQIDQRKLANNVYELIHANQTFFIYEMVLTGLSFIIDYVIVVLLFALMSQIMTPIRLPLKIRFRLSTYLSISYLLVQLILILVGYNSFFIALWVPYFYHLYVYRKMTFQKVDVKHE